MPVIWLIDAYRAGERGQVRALVDALGWPSELVSLRYRQWAVWPHLFGSSSVAGLVAESRARLQPPWPDLVVSCGVRNEPVCRWIREQSGGKTRYVHVGRPWGSLDSFDLVVTTPQYRVPDHPAVLNNELTLHRFSTTLLDEAAGKWRHITEGLAAPYVAVVIGGDSGPFTFGPRAARRLAAEAGALAAQLGGSLLITSSSRTSAAALDELEAALDVPHYLYRWRPDDAANNPYRGLLGLASHIVVTGDSIAMLSEACASRASVWMFDLGGMRETHPVARDFRPGGTLYAAMLRWLWQPLSRDITLVHRRLVDSGRARWLGEGEAAALPPEPPADLARAVDAVRRLLGEHSGAIDTQ